MGKTKNYEMNMVLEYARVFKENADMGNSESSEVWLRNLAKAGGKTTVNAYFTSEDQLQNLIDEGYEVTYKDNKTGKTHNRVREGEYGIGKYIKIERLIKDIKEFKDKKTGKFKEVDFGGLPEVIYQLDGMANNRKWSFTDDGEVGNGSEAVIAFSVYNGQKSRLEAVAVTSHVEWVKGDTGLSSTFKISANNPAEVKATLDDNIPF